MVSKLSMKSVSKNVEKCLNNIHFIVGVLGGGEVIFHNANMMLTRKHGDGSLAMLLIYF